MAFGIIEIAVLGGLLFVAVLLRVPRLLGGRRGKVKVKNFEPEPVPPNHITNFFLIALLFIILEVEILYLYPWAAAFQITHIPFSEEHPNGLGLPAFWEMFTFVATTIALLVYTWRRGNLRWM